MRWSWVNFKCRGVLPVWIRVGQGPTALAVGAGGGCLDIFTLIYPFSSLSPSLWETTRYRLKDCLKGSFSPKTTNQLNPLRCYACQVFGHHQNKCHREELCANCGQPKHSADETDCKRPAKCFNCNEDHPANSKQCQAWHTEKEILKVKYTRNISFPEAQKIVESYTAAPGKSYASITKTAGVTVSCVDAATQTDPVLITAAPQSSSYKSASTEASASTQKDMSEQLSQKDKQKQEKADKKLPSIRFLQIMRRPLVASLSL